MNFEKLPNCDKVTYIFHGTSDFSSRQLINAWGETEKILKHHKCHFAPEIKTYTDVQEDIPHELIQLTHKNNVRFVLMISLMDTYTLRMDSLLQELPGKYGYTSHIDWWSKATLLFKTRDNRSIDSKLSKNQMLQDMVEQVGKRYSCILSSKVDDKSVGFEDSVDEIRTTFPESNNINDETRSVAFKCPKFNISCCKDRSQCPKCDISCCKDRSLCPKFDISCCKDRSLCPKFDVSCCKDRSLCPKFDISCCRAIRLPNYCQSKAHIGVLLTVIIVLIIILIIALIVCVFLIAKYA